MGNKQGVEQLVGGASSPECASSTSFTSTGTIADLLRQLSPITELTSGGKINAELSKILDMVSALMQSDCGNKFLFTKGGGFQLLNSYLNIADDKINLSCLRCIQNGITSNRTSTEVYNYTQEQISEFKESFDIFDEDQNGVLTYHELELLIKSLGVAKSDVEIVDFIDTLYGNQEECSINFSEFLRLVAQTSGEQEDGNNNVDASTIDIIIDTCGASIVSIIASHSETKFDICEAAIKIIVLLWNNIQGLKSPQVDKLQETFVKMGICQQLLKICDFHASNSTTIEWTLKCLFVLTDNNEENSKLIITLGLTEVLCKSIPIYLADGNILLSILKLLIRSFQISSNSIIKFCESSALQPLAKKLVAPLSLQDKKMWKAYENINKMLVYMVKYSAIADLEEKMKPTVPTGAETAVSSTTLVSFKATVYKQLRSSGISAALTKSLFYQQSICDSSISFKITDVNFTISETLKSTLSSLVTLTKGYSDLPAVLGELGACEVISCVLAKHFSNRSIAENVIKSIISLGENEANKKRFGEKNVFPAIKEALIYQSSRDDFLTEIVLRSIVVLVNKCQDNKDLCRKNGILGAICEALRANLEKSNVIEWCVVCMIELCNKCSANQTDFAPLAAPALALSLQSALSLPNDIDDNARKSSLCEWASKGIYLLIDSNPDNVTIVGLAGCIPPLLQSFQYFASLAFKGGDSGRAVARPHCIVIVRAMSILSEKSENREIFAQSPTIIYLFHCLLLYYENDRAMAKVILTAMDTLANGITHHNAITTAISREKITAISLIAHCFSIYEFDTAGNDACTFLNLKSIISSTPESALVCEAFGKSSSKQSKQSYQGEKNQTSSLVMSGDEEDGNFARASVSALRPTMKSPKKRQSDSAAVGGHEESSAPSPIPVNLNPKPLASMTFEERMELARRKRDQEVFKSNWVSNLFKFHTASVEMKPFSINKLGSTSTATATAKATATTSNASSGASMSSIINPPSVMQASVSSASPPALPSTSKEQDIETLRAYFSDKCSISPDLSTKMASDFVLVYDIRSLQELNKARHADKLDGILKQMKVDVEDSSSIMLVTICLNLFKTFKD